MGEGVALLANCKYKYNLRRATDEVLHTIFTNNTIASSPQVSFSKGEVTLSPFLRVAKRHERNECQSGGLAERECDRAAARRVAP